MRAKAIYPCRSTILLRTAGGATGRRNRAAFTAAFRHVMAGTAPALRGNTATVRMTGKILGSAKSRLAICYAAVFVVPDLCAVPVPRTMGGCHGCHNDAELVPCPAANRRLQFAPWRVRCVSQDADSGLIGILHLLHVSEQVPRYIIRVLHYLQGMKATILYCTITCAWNSCCAIPAGMRLCSNLWIMIESYNQCESDH